MHALPLDLGLRAATALTLNAVADGHGRDRLPAAKPPVLVNSVVLVVLVILGRKAMLVMLLLLVILLLVMAVLLVMLLLVMAVLLAGLIGLVPSAAQLPLVGRVRSVNSVGAPAPTPVVLDAVDLSDALSPYASVPPVVQAQSMLAATLMALVALVAPAKMLVCVPTPSPAAAGVGVPSGPSLSVDPTLVAATLATGHPIPAPSAKVLVAVKRVLVAVDALSLVKAHGLIPDAPMLDACAGAPCQGVIDVVSAVDLVVVEPKPKPKPGWDVLHQDPAADQPKLSVSDADPPGSIVTPVPSSLLISSLTTP